MNRKKAEGEEVEYWPRLQMCYLNSNKISNFTAVVAPKLQILDLSHNEISTIPETDDGFKGHETLEFLDLSRNKLTNLSMLRGMPNLREFYASSNVNIRKLQGLEECRSLEVLHLRGCAVNSIEIQGDSFPNLKLINLRENALNSVKEIEKLNGFKTLETIVVSFNPFVTDNPDTYVYEILSRLGDLDALKQLNKNKVCNEMRRETAAWLEEKKAEARALKEKEEREKKDKDDDK